MLRKIENALNIIASSLHLAAGVIVFASFAFVAMMLFAPQLFFRLFYGV
ncbi:MAG: hypothetical protein AAFX03_10630 [Pseudomonadota bacterium]